MAELAALRQDPAAGGTAQQLVVLCHGVGASGHDLIGLVPVLAQALPHAAFAAPDAPEPYDGAPMGRQWFSLADRRPAVLQAGAEGARPALDGFIDAELRRLALAPSHCALVGFSQGAMMALHAGLRRAPPLAGVLAFSGALLLAPDQAGPVRPPPVLLVHGERDGVVPATRSRDAERALRKAGVPVEALFLAELEHGIDDRGLLAGAAFLRQAFAVDQ